MAYSNTSSNEDYPKSLIIRNTVGGMIWQVYTVEKLTEAEKLAVNATANGFFGITLEDFDEDQEETSPGWRDTPGGKVICA
jgi:hypothetical protein